MREGPRAVLLDIEGTTTPVDFVYKVLFPYAYERLETWLRAHGNEADVVRPRSVSRIIERGEPFEL